MEGKTEFDRLMREAVAIKSAQLSQYRKKFDLWPQFHQAGLYYSESFLSLRSSPISDKLKVYEEKKQEGTQLFNSGDFQQALHKYEETLTLFRWVKNRNEKWRNSGIEDDDLTVETIEQTPEAIENMVALYLNISICNIKLQNWKEAVAACEEALALDRHNVKALYRKSIALTLPAGSDLDDYRTAIKLLSQALEIEPKNVAVRQKLMEFSNFLKEQKVKSKSTFHSFFKKPTYEDAQPEKPGSTVKEYEELIEKGENMVKDLKSHGKKQEAKKLEKNVKLMKEYKKKALENAKKKALDFDNPNEEMRENAKKFGLDLDDPQVRTILNEMKNKKEMKLNDSDNDELEDIVKAVEKKNGNKWFDFKFWILGFLLLVVGAYFYAPKETELW